MLGLPDDLTGRTVLDVGAWDGFFSFEAERRGAARVVAADSFAWNGENWGTRPASSSRAAPRIRVRTWRSTCSSSIRTASAGSTSCSSSACSTTCAIHCWRSRRWPGHRRQLIVETAVDCTWTRGRRRRSTRTTGCDKDPTNWWGPNPEAVVGMLHAVGLPRVEVVSRDTWAYRFARTARRLPPYLRAYARDRRPPPDHPAQGRAVIHAFR